MMLVSNIPVVEVMLGGTGPHRFAIDTGAQGHGRISPALAEKLGLKIAGEAQTPAPGGKVASRPIFAAPAIALGGVTFHGAELLAAAPTRGLNPGWQGILGIDLFRDLTLTLDYANGAAGVSRQPLAGGVQVTFEDGIPSIPVTIGGRAFTVHLDTGNGASPLFLPEADVRSLPLSGEPVERGRARTSFGEFAIMEATLGAPVTVGDFTLPLRTIGWPPARGGGNLGSRGLIGTVLQVDRTNGRVAVSAPATRLSCAVS